MATTLAGNGEISTAGGTGGPHDVWGPCTIPRAGGAGRIRLEALTLTYSVDNATPGVVSSGAPRHLFLRSPSSLRVVSVNGVPVSAAPMGVVGGVDVELPGAGTFPVTIAATNIPPGTTVSVTAKPETDGSVIGPLTSPALQGAFEISQTTIDVAFPAGGVYFIEARATFALP